MRALFLDRDGVINEEHNYVHRIDDFVFMNGIFELCRSAKNIGMAIVVITNQAGIGRGYYSEEQFNILTDWMKSRFIEEGIAIDAVYFCPFHPTHGVGAYKKESYDRKPNPGMLFRARDELGIDLASSFFVGDNATDIAAARSASIGTAVLVTDEKNKISPFPDYYAKSLIEVNAWLFG